MARLKGAVSPTVTGFKLSPRRVWCSRDAWWFFGVGSLLVIVAFFFPKGQDDMLVAPVGAPSRSPTWRPKVGVQEWQQAAVSERFVSSVGRRPTRRPERESAP